MTTHMDDEIKRMAEAESAWQEKEGGDLTRGATEYIVPKHVVERFAPLPEIFKNAALARGGYTDLKPGMPVQGTYGPFEIHSPAESRPLTSPEFGEDGKVLLEQPPGTKIHELREAISKDYGVDISQEGARKAVSEFIAALGLVPTVVTSIEMEPGKVYIQGPFGAWDVLEIGPVPVSKPKKAPAPRRKKSAE